MTLKKSCETLIKLTFIEYISFVTLVYNVKCSLLSRRASDQAQQPPVHAGLWRAQGEPLGAQAGSAVAARPHDTLRGVPGKGDNIKNIFTFVC